MSYTITINSNSAQAESLVQFLKSLDFVDVKKKKETKVATVAPEVLEEDEDGMPIAYKDFIAGCFLIRQKIIAFPLNKMGLFFCLSALI